MSTYMAVGMGIWMWYRGHGWTSVEEMDAAMYLPFFVLIGPFEAGWVGEAGFLIVMHALMLPCMLVVMLRRRYEYSEDHRHHDARHVADPTGAERPMRAIPDALSHRPEPGTPLAGRR